MIRPLLPSGWLARDVTLRIVRLGDAYVVAAVDRAGTLIAVEVDGRQVRASTADACRRALVRSGHEVGERVFATPQPFNPSLARGGHAEVRA